MSTDPQNPTPIDSETSGLLGMAIVIALMDAITHKGHLLTNSEAEEIYRKALSHISEPTQNAEAKRILKIFLPNFQP